MLPRGTDSVEELVPVVADSLSVRTAAGELAVGS